MLTTLASTSADYGPGPWRSHPEMVRGELRVCEDDESGRRILDFRSPAPTLVMVEAPVDTIVRVIKIKSAVNTAVDIEVDGTYEGPVWARTPQVFCLVAPRGRIRSMFELIGQPIR